LGNNLPRGKYLKTIAAVVSTPYSRILDNGEKARHGKTH